MPADPAAEKHAQYRALVYLSVGVAAFTAALSLSHGGYFQRFFGSTHPLAAVIVVSALGSVSLRLLQTRGGLEIYAGVKSLRGVGLSAVLAPLFAIGAIGLDLCKPFPQNLNVPAPQSLLFYPVMAFVAEMVFHAVPLAILLAVLQRVLKKPHGTVVWAGIAVASLLEPIFQVIIGAREQPAPWVQGYVGLHVLGFNAAQLYVFQRYDFISMYALRLVYYVLWHIVWGHVRLQLVF